MIADFILHLAVCTYHNQANGARFDERRAKEWELLGIVVVSAYISQAPMHRYKFFVSIHSRQVAMDAAYHDGENSASNLGRALRWILVS
jgi:hypothetical protein